MVKKIIILFLQQSYVQNVRTSFEYYCRELVSHLQLPHRSDLEYLNIVREMKKRGRKNDEKKTREKSINKNDKKED